MELTYWGHSCFSVKVGGKRLLFDPFISGNAMAGHIKLGDIQADYILISHGHADHTADAIEIAMRTKAMVISNWEIASWAAKQGCNTHPMNIGGIRSFEFGTVKCVSAIHSSSFDDGSYAGNPMGFVVDEGKEAFYYSGDTALTMDMQLIPKYKAIKFAILPIGDNFTMGVEDAVLAADMIGTRRVVGVHYDTFGYIKIDHLNAIKAFEHAGKELFLMDIGSTRDL